MTQDEIRKLLGGYATDALTAEERRTLFDAALDDQELFNALQNEDALRELLADPVSREQVRRAIESPARKPSRRPFSWRRWVYGVALPAVAAVVVITMMNRPKAPDAIAPPIRTQLTEPPSATNQAATRAFAPPPVAPLQLAKKRAKSEPSAQTTSAPIQPEPAGDVAQTIGDLGRPARATRLAMALRAPGPPPLPDAIRQQFSAGFSSDTKLYQGPLLQYSLVRSGLNGEAVRVQVSTRITGYLALYRVDGAGKSTRVYPESDPATLVRPDLTIQIPSTPIKVAATERLRLVVVPAAQSGSIGQLGGRLGTIGGVLPATAEPAQASPTPMVVDIPLAP